MTGNNPDSFMKWLGRRSDWKTKVIVLVVFLLAGIGFVTIMNCIWTCKASEHCYSTEYDPADHQW